MFTDQGNRVCIASIQLSLPINTSGDVMKTLILFSFLASVLFCSCFTVGSATFPNASKNFIPRKTYPQPFDTLWNAVQNTLVANRITIASQDKENMSIQTDYIQGITQASLLGSESTRYKYSIIFTSTGSHAFTMHIVATLEATSKGNDWNEVSKDNPALVRNLENWLYEKIENQLK